MKQLFSSKGQVVIEDGPAPLPGAGEVLVQVHYSCISSGTEVGGVRNFWQSLYQKAIRQPEKIGQFVEMVRAEGLESVMERLQSLANAPIPLGYSASGVVLEVGNKITNIQKGDRVACAGAGVANHAECIVVPRNLLVKIPDGVSLQLASTVTLGSIALQGVRRTQPALGECVAVIGLGVIGQLTVQLLKANGCRILGIDHDPRRIAAAVSLGMHHGVNAAQENVSDEVRKFSKGFGVDYVLITASTSESTVINQAIEICRKKGKVVVVGDVGLDIKREEFYKKELDVLISTSYGPGRYDDTYEVEGRDYPYAYVRWTENRNMEAYITLLDQKAISVSSLVERVSPLESAATLYEELKSSATKPLICLLEYQKEISMEHKVMTATPAAAQDRIKIAVIGAGEFVKNVHLPSLNKLNDLFSIHAISSRKGASAQALAKQYGAQYATSDYHDVLNDKDVGCVLIATRHHLHARIAKEAARAGKAVFLEKPMAITREELNELRAVLEETKVPFFVGFNRRFSPLLQEIKRTLKARDNPLIINYRMNAGFLPQDHWVHSGEGGGRNIGEACHIYDVFNFLTDSAVHHISASSIAASGPFNRNDNFVASIKYKDGSLANLIYTALGTPKAPKEEMDIYAGGKIIRLNDYQKLEFIGSNIPARNLAAKKKGHHEEWGAFAESIKNGNGFAIPLEQLIQATEISFEVEEQITQ